MLHYQSKVVPSYVAPLLQTAGFRVGHRATEAIAQTFVCNPIAFPFVHRLATETGARAEGIRVSMSGTTRPA